MWSPFNPCSMLDEHKQMKRWLEEPSGLAPLLPVDD